MFQSVPVWDIELKIKRRIANKMGVQRHGTSHLPFGSAPKAQLRERGGSLEGPPEELWRPEGNRFPQCAFKIPRLLGRQNPRMVHPAGMAPRLQDVGLQDFAGIDGVQRHCDQSGSLCCQGFVVPKPIEQLAATLPCYAHVSLCEGEKTGGKLHQWVRWCERARLFQRQPSLVDRNRRPTKPVQIGIDCEHPVDSQKLRIFRVCSQRLQCGPVDSSMASSGGNRKIGIVLPQDILNCAPPLPCFSERKHGHVAARLQVDQDIRRRPPDVLSNASAVRSRFAETRTTGSSELLNPCSLPKIRSAMRAAVNPSSRPARVSSTRKHKRSCSLVDRRKAGLSRMRPSSRIRSSLSGRHRPAVRWFGELSNAMRSSTGVFEDMRGFYTIGGTHVQTYGFHAALAEKYGPGTFATLHIDAHCDTDTYGFGRFVHNGSFLKVAIEKGLIKGSDLIQVGLRGEYRDNASLQ